MPMLAFNLRLQAVVVKAPPFAGTVGSAPQRWQNAPISRRD